MDSENIVLYEGEIIDIDTSVILENVIILQSDNEVNKLEEFGCSSTIFTLPEVEILNLEFEETALEENSNQIIQEVMQAKKSRKRKANPDIWQRNIRHKQYQSGQTYKNSRGKIVPAKTIASKKDCLTHCRFKCEKKITKTEREELFNAFYSMNQQEKADFILKMTTRTETIRKTKKSAHSLRTYSFGFFVDLNGNRVQVCKPYWLGTFAISQKPVYNAHKSKNIITGVAKKNGRGLKSHQKIPEHKLMEIKDHISSFPAIESHYCRANTSKLYLDPNLNIRKMYHLYQDKVKDPVKESFYRHVFNNSFNLDFHRPKSDRCGKCEMYIVAEKENIMTEEMTLEKEEHNNLKKMMREQKSLDKQSGIPILTFDLENVLSCPRAEIGPLFYHSKLSIYNLTAHLSSTKKIYCAIWTEHTGGRSGNDIASALIKILEKVFEDNDITQLITWSDSCVPQNKNSIMALAVKHFLKTHPDVQSILMKYSLPGHSALQEVDNAHSQIEKHLSKNEYFSPMGLIRLLKNVNSRSPFVIIQMKPSDFKNFGRYTKICFDFKNVPFTKLKMLRVTQTEYEIEFSYDYKFENLKTIGIRRNATKLRKNKPGILEVPILQEVESVSTKMAISHEKEKHLISMFKYMSLADIAYYKVILKIGNTSETTE